MSRWSHHSWTRFALEVEPVSHRRTRGASQAEEDGSDAEFSPGHGEAPCHGTEARLRGRGREERHSPSRTSSSPLSVAMIALVRKSLDQAQLDPDKISKARGGGGAEGRDDCAGAPLRKAATGTEEKKARFNALEYLESRQEPREMMAMPRYEVLRGED